MDADSTDDPAPVDDAAPGRDPREDAGGARKQAADRRDAAAGAREAAADERERIADAREAAADAREAKADAWHEDIAAREQRLDQRLRAAGQPAPTRTQRSYEEIERTEELLRASQARLDRRRAALRREQGADTREQDAVDREVAASAAPHTHHQRSVQALEAVADRLRSKTLAALQKLAALEDNLTRQLAQQGEAGRAAEHRDRAAQIRTAAEMLDTTGND